MAVAHSATSKTPNPKASFIFNPMVFNTNMDQIAKLVKESADGAKESAKACQGLSGLALDLQKLPH